GLMNGVKTGDMSQLLPQLGASLTYHPAVRVLGGNTVVLFVFLRAHAALFVNFLRFTIPPRLRGAPRRFRLVRQIT
uniref:hypothetical protein n=1 Tax=Nocardia cyriacigeorgica TaxID=135487 RepID=UPI0024555F64